VGVSVQKDIIEPMMANASYPHNVVGKTKPMKNVVPVLLQLVTKKHPNAALDVLLVAFVHARIMSVMVTALVVLAFHMPIVQNRVQKMINSKNTK
jgi:hypothetical protein